MHLLLSLISHIYRSHLSLSNTPIYETLGVHVDLSWSMTHYTLKAAQKYCKMHLSQFS